MTLEVRHVPIQYVNQAWPMVERFIADAVEFGGDDYTLEQVRVYVTTGQWLLVVAVTEEGVIKGAATVSFHNYPNDRVAFVVAIGGKLFTSQDTWQQFVDLLKSRGATRVEGAARESIARLWKRYGFEEKYRIVGVSL